MNNDILSFEQFKAVSKMSNGCILNGDVGTGKSRTGLYYYFKEQGGFYNGKYLEPMTHPKDLYIITTAMKRDSHEWEGELLYFLISKDKEITRYPDLKVTIDSWNNIKKYTNIKNAFFIFDEDRVTGNGVWVKSFLKIAKVNDWIILSATPGDTWSDYIPVFIANGFYKNRTEFNNDHVIFSRYTKWPQVDRYINTGRLVRLRNRILVDIPIERCTIPHHDNIYVTYDISKYKEVMRNRWDPYKNEPIEQAATLCYILRRIVNEDDSRIVALMEILEKTPRAIIFYNFDYELEMLRHLFWCGDGEDCELWNGFEVAEWNGHMHQPIPESKRWVYLVQYTAGCEGWNCIRTDTIIFFSQNYSYKVMKQAEGRINRMNTPYTNLYYYHLKSRSGIDLAISKALSQKEEFNEGKFLGGKYD